METMKRTAFRCAIASLILCVAMAGYILYMRLTYGTGVLYANGLDASGVSYGDMNQYLLYELVGAALICYLPALVAEKMKRQKETFTVLFDNLFSSMATNLLISLLLLITLADYAAAYRGRVLYRGGAPVLIGSKIYSYTTDLWVLGIGSLLLLTIGIWFIVRAKAAQPDRKGFLWIFRQ